MQIFYQNFGATLNASSIQTSSPQHSLLRTKAIEFCRIAMFYSFLLYLFTFSFSIVLRDAFPVIGCVFLVAYYALNAQESALHYFDGKRYFVCFYAFLFCGVAFSINVERSFLVFALHSFTSIALPFIALECVRTRRHFSYIVWVLVIMLILQGFNGIYQYFYGVDFINNTPIRTGRLTGSFSDYRVGNYIALCLIPASCVYFFLKERFSAKALPFTLMLFSPAFFLLFFSYTRNAYIALCAAVFLYCILMRFFSWKFFLSLLVLAFGLTQISNIRLSLDIIMRDERWQLWTHAVEIFKTSPLTGVGLGQYRPSMHALALSQDTSVLAMSHPHNIYLQFLCETGLVGTFFVLIFLFGLLYWGYRKLLLLKPYLAHKGQTAYWKSMCILWCGFGAFLTSGIVGHNFFQRWWLALVMAFWGIFMSLVVQTQREMEKDRLHK